MHGASEWLLRKWQLQDKLMEIQRELSTGEVIGNRQWYINRQGQSLAIIPPVTQFLMGSPAWEIDREGGVTGQFETQHFRRIDRTYAIMMHEVTVDQFSRWRQDDDYSKRVSPTGNHPINMVTWYETAEYCNWLSEQEGIPQSEWCYLPNSSGTYAAGMKLAPNYLKRTGYRLPTEAEWEYASRGGAVTSRFYGASEELLGNYAWYTKNSLDRGMLPVGTLKPNDFGLFDILGNALEWCHERAQYYSISSDGAVSMDVEDGAVVRDTEVRLLRGGSYSLSASNARSAYRLRDLPGTRTDVLGFRVARTYR